MSDACTSACTNIQVAYYKYMQFRSDMRRISRSSNDASRATPSPLRLCLVPWRLLLHRQIHPCSAIPTIRLFFNILHNPPCMTHRTTVHRVQITIWFLPIPMHARISFRHLAQRSFCLHESISICRKPVCQQLQLPFVQLRVNQLFHYLPFPWLQAHPRCSHSSI